MSGNKFNFRECKVNWKNLVVIIELEYKYVS